VETRHLFVADHAEVVWYRVINLGQIHFSHLKYAPVITGIVLACIQYLPEMIGERLRLSLHLPVSPHRLILAHIFVGLTAVGVVIVFNLAALWLITVSFFPVEVTIIALYTALPWCLAGMAAYLGGTLGLLEPGYRLKSFNVAVAAGVTGLFLHSAEPGGYAYLLFKLLIPVLLMIPAVLLPAYRYRYRRVV
jgi:hypothetical protein